MSKQWKAKSYFAALSALVITLAVWMLYTYPLPQYTATGIPGSHHKSDTPAARVMFPGDHLQLMYHFWLAGDMLTGQTPLFYNIYELNTGDDKERYEPGAYYAPFSIVYSLLAALGGRALGWNLTGLLALWLTAWFTWKLASRYTDKWPVAALAGLIGIALPYRWVSLLGGSPTGFAMAWIPILWLGLDDAIRRNRLSAGFLAAAVIVFSCWTDTHVFFFAVLSIPMWGLIALIQQGRPKNGWRTEIKRLLVVLSPVIAGVVLSYGFTKWIALSLDESVSAGGRKLSEIALFSPIITGLFSRAEQGINSQVYLGYAVIALIAGGLLVTILRAIRNRTGYKPLILSGLLIVFISGCALLALGPRGPLDGRLFISVRKLIPPYSMIRQPAKIFALLPTLMAMALVISWSSVKSLRIWKLSAGMLALIAGIIIAVEYAGFCDPSICILRSEQQAYEAVATDAESRGIKPHAIVLTLWPGDSHYTSVYQDYASLYRIRLINGYRPMVPKTYVEEVFRPYESMNQGVIFREHLDQLQSSGIHYILLHEDLYPEKVGPFPVGTTLDRLLKNTRLELLAQDGPVWAFRILNQQKGNPPDIRITPYYYPAWHWEAERCHREQCNIATDDQASWLVFHAPKASLITRPYLVSSYYDNHWMIRLRGQGVIEVKTIGSDTSKTAVYPISSYGWTWLKAGFERPGPFGLLQLEIKLQSGNVDIDQFYLGGKSPDTLTPGEKIEMPAAGFFHAGYTDISDNSVILRKDYDPSGAIFYGFNLPLEPGKYQIDFNISTDETVKDKLGTLSVMPIRKYKPISTVRVKQSGVTSLVFETKDNRPIRINFDYARTADLKIKTLTLTRLE